MNIRRASGWAPVQRPNGKWYRPRKLPSAELLGDENGAEVSILVTRCDDYETAWVLAVQEVQAWDGGYTAANPQFGWWRKGIRDNETYWEYDEARGAPGYTFDIVDKIS